MRGTKHNKNVSIIDVKRIVEERKGDGMHHRKKTCAPTPPHLSTVKVDEQNQEERYSSDKDNVVIFRGASRAMGGEKR